MRIKFSQIKLLLVIAVTLTLTGCRQQRSHYITIEGSVWHTTYHITYESDRDLTAEILSTLKDVEMSLSPFESQSLISAINNNNTDETDSLVATVFESALYVNREISPYFDPTVAPLLNLWGFGHNNASNYSPAQDEIDSCLRSVGLAECSIYNGRMIKKSPETQFNFSAITKGFGCDQVGETLKNNGVENYMVEIGGEIALAGKNPAGQPWRIMIDAPIQGSLPGSEELTTISLTNCGIATSGNYRNYRSTADGMIGHTLSPMTGIPQSTSLLSATVIAPSAMLADAVATALMATPDTELDNVISRLPDNFGAILVGRNDNGDNFEVETFGIASTLTNVNFSN